MTPDLPYWLTLGGHGPYVWGSLAACAILWSLEIILLRRRWQQACRHTADLEDA